MHADAGRGAEPPGLLPQRRRADRRGQLDRPERSERFDEQSRTDAAAVILRIRQIRCEDERVDGRDLWGEQRGGAAESSERPGRVDLRCAQPEWLGSVDPSERIAIGGEAGFMGLTGFVAAP
jgi:hypothetical protein